SCKAELIKGITTSKPITLRISVIPEISPFIIWVPENNKIIMLINKINNGNLNFVKGVDNKQNKIIANPNRGSISNNKEFSIKKVTKCKKTKNKNRRNKK